MNESEDKKIEIEKENNNERNEIIDMHNIKLDNDTLDILNKIFEKSKIDNSQFIPILQKNAEDDIFKIFNEEPSVNAQSSLDKFIFQKLKLISKILSIINESPEILHVISNFLLIKNTSIFIYIIELYFSYITLEQNNNMKGSIITEIKKIFSVLISYGLLTKKDVDYIYQKIALFQLENKLTIKLFNDIISLLQTIYGSENNCNIKPNLISKKYIYFYDKDNSAIETNISKRKFIQIKNGFTVILRFYLKELNEENEYKCSLLYLKNDKDDKINIELNDKNDIDIKYNDNIYLKEKGNKNFDIKKNLWIELRVCINKNEINLSLSQNVDDNNNKDSIKENYMKKNYEVNMIKNFSFYKCKIYEIVFFRNFIGIAGNILFFDEIDIDKKFNNECINKLFNMKNKNVNEILSDKTYSKNLCLIFSPNLYFKDENILSPQSNIIGILPPSNNNNKFNLNSIFSFHNYINNIFYLGGFNNFLPLFEIFYKFTLNIDNAKEKNEELIIIFNKLFKLMETVFTKEKNCKIPLEKDNNFFDILQIFLEKIDEKYYYNNIDLLNIFLNITKKYNESKTIEKNHKINFFFNPEIIIKFNLQLQKTYFEEIKNFSLISPLKYISKFLLLLSQKYQKNEIEKNNYSEVIFNCIKIVFESINTKDADRETLFLLYKNKYNKISNNLILSDNIFIHIIKIFVLYLDIKNTSFDNKQSKKEQRIQTVNYLLNSENYFIENLLKYLSETNIHVKKVIINFLRELILLIIYYSINL